MPANNEPKRTFLNRRDWSSYLTALQNAATYPKVMEAVRSGRQWFSLGATQTSNWLAGRAELLASKAEMLANKAEILTGGTELLGGSPELGDKLSAG